MSEQPRNAAAGQRQKQYIKDNNKEAGKSFSEYGLTRKNEEFVYQLNKHLDAKGVAADKKDTWMSETNSNNGKRKGKLRRPFLGPQRPTQMNY